MGSAQYRRRRYVFYDRWASGFRFQKADEKKTDYKLRFPDKKALEYILVDLSECVADPGTVYKLELEDGFCALNEEMFEHDALIFDGGQFDEVWLCHKGGEPYVGMKCKGFPNFGIWYCERRSFRLS